PTDSAAIASELKKQANKALADNLNNYIDVPVALDSTLTDQAKQEAKKRLEEELNTNIPTDSAAIANKAASMADQTIKDETGIDIKGVPKDSASVAKEAKDLLKSEFASQTGLEAPDITIDSTTVDQVKEKATQRVEEEIENSDYFKELGNPENGGVGDVQETMEQLKQQNAKSELKKKMTSQARDYLTQNSEKIQQVQSRMSELKKKYSMVPDSDDLSTAKKRGSLKGESFWKRL
ncbi:hypothetical protein, partial [Fulvivirga lutimaris]|uniref:hypothetical protein n=1 Tax=Fulvivirga lutimaris TaxID=1819566 RepID=UPI001C86C2CC